MNSENQDKINIKKKKVLRRFIILIVALLLCILAGLIYRSITWNPVNTKYQNASKRVLLKSIAWQLNHSFEIEKDPNELTDEDFANFPVKKLLI